MNRIGAAPTDLFLSLTPEKVLEAVEAAGLHCNPVCYPLNSFENRVYEVELQDRSRIIAKFYRPGRWSERQILEEHTFLADLEADEIPVCPVRPFPDGSTLKRQDSIFYSLAERRGGRAPDEMSDELAVRLGRLVARLHNVAVRRPVEHRVHLCGDTYVRDNVDFLVQHGVLPSHLQRRYLDAAEDLASLADELMADVTLHRLHGDLHLGNLLVRDGLLHVLDFDDSVLGPAVQDVWLAFPGRDAETVRQRQLFLDAYEEFRLFDHQTLRLVEVLRGLRLVHYATWLARRWHDPIFPATWTHFGTEDYWLRESEDLEECLRLVHEQAPAASAAAGIAQRRAELEEELSNKDYFWDWEGD